MTEHEEKQLEELHKRHEQEELSSYKDGIYLGFMLGIFFMLIIYSAIK